MGRMNCFLAAVLIACIYISVLTTVSFAELSTAEEFSKIACKATLKTIQADKRRWAEDHSMPEDATPTWNDLVPAYRKSIPMCRYSVDGYAPYTLGKVKEPPTCTIKEHNLTSAEFDEVERVFR